MQKYTYKHPNAIETTTRIHVYDDTGKITHSFERYYSNSLKKFFDKAMDYRYFLYYKVYDANETLVFTCKKVSKKGRVYYEAIDHLQQKTYIVAYDKWKELIPDLTITDGNIQIRIQKEMENWSLFTHNEKEIARWKAEIGDQFSIYLEIEDDSPIQNVAFFIAISQCALFVGG
ncbi:hypothetical protein [Bacillus sp. Cr_A10]|uniref:tubby C-terminal domain-like protein n=1 Tax=Bacillus sp. Cr_A10 TaxID=3033993 RepID=UPI0023DB1C12|nr:hypothetical protein [Bacillus sp. Cr_A10]MDF2067294.1 hypothetical protein [Bacillus sp. Cr_A10]